MKRNWTQNWHDYTLFRFLRECSSYKVHLSQYLWWMNTNIATRVIVKKKKKNVFKHQFHIQHEKATFYRGVAELVFFHSHGTNNWQVNLQLTSVQEVITDGQCSLLKHSLRTMGYNRKPWDAGWWRKYVHLYRQRNDDCIWLCKF